MKRLIYEKFLKDNNLKLGYNSAKEFVDLIDEPNYDEEILSEEYTEYAESLLSKKSKINNYIKACKVCPKNIVARILLFDNLKNKRTNIINFDLINDSDFIIPYKEKTKSFTDYLVDELNQRYNELIKNDIYHPEYDSDLFRLGYESKQYLWAIKKLYINFIEKWDLNNAYKVGERLLALNPNDDLNVLDSLPYLYLYLDMVDDAKICSSNSRMDNTERYLLNACIDLIEKRYDNALNELLELHKMNSFIIKMIATSYNPKNIKNILTDNNDFSFASYLYVNLMLSGGKENIIKDFIIKNINEFN